MGLFGKGKHHSVTEQEWGTLLTEMTILRSRLEASEKAKSHLEDQLRALDATTAALADDRTRIETVELRARVVELEGQLDRVAELAARPAPPPMEPSVVIPDTSAIEARIAELAGQLGQFAERLSGTDASMRGLNDQMAVVQQRITSISTELANQITELSGDIDALAQLGESADTGAVSDEVLEALRTAQVKLAAEQARYEIAFRQDLAELAERLGRRHQP